MYEPCLNCGSPSFTEKWYFKHPERTIMTCNECGLVQVNPRNNMLNLLEHEDVALREEKLEKLFALMVKNSCQELSEIMEKETIIKTDHFRSRIRHIERYRSSGKLLDVGSAQGAFLSALKGRGFQGYGVEPSKYSYAESLKIATGCTVYNSTLLEAELGTDSFDIVTIINTLEHLLNPKDAIGEAYRILAPGGLLMIETPDISHWIPKLLGKRWFQLMVPDHVAFFSESILRDMLKKTGFEVKDTMYSHKTMSLRLLFFHLRHYSMSMGDCLLKVIERTGLADRTISIPQWDEMVVFAIKPYRLFST